MTRTNNTGTVSKDECLHLNDILGVKTLAGYAKTKRNGTVRFVISLGGRTGKLRFRLLNLIEKEL